MTHRSLWLLPLLLLVCLTSCRNHIELTGFEPGEEVELIPTLTFHFDEEMEVIDSLNHWHDASYILFTPELSGQYQWSDSRTLKFVPDAVLQKATTYTFGFNEDALGDVSVDSELPLEFHTPFQKVQDVHLTWKKKYYESYRPSVSATIDFTYPVKWSDARDYVSVFDGGKQITDLNFRSSAGGNLEVIWDEPDGIEDTKTYNLLVREGLPGAEEDLSLREEQLIEADLAATSTLSLSDFKHNNEGARMILDLRFNQPVRPEILEEHLSFSPPKPFTISEGGSEIRVELPVEAGEEVQFLLRNGMKGLYGGTLQHPFTKTVRIDDYKPFCRFTTPAGIYLRRNGFENISVTSVNVDSFEVHLYEIYENNLVHFLNRNRLAYRNDYETEEDYRYGYGQYVSISDYGKEIYRDVYRFDSSHWNEVQTRQIHVRKEEQRKFRGIFAMEIAYPGERYGYEEDSRVISLSDLGLIAKGNEGEYQIFVNSLASARPQAGVRVQLHSRTNQILAEGSTDANGQVKLRIPSTLRDFDVCMVSARTASDFNFLDLNRTRIQKYAYELPTYDPEQQRYAAFIHAESNLYRPGDTAHISVILRDKDWNLPRNEPFRYTVTDARGNEFITAKANCNRQGGFEVAVPLRVNQPTGVYTFNVSTLDEQSLDNFRFNVEEFVPDRIQGWVTTPDATFEPGDTVNLPIEAAYYFGAPCDSHRYEIDWSFNHERMYSLQYHDFQLNRFSSEAKRIEGFQEEGMLDSQGQDLVQYAIPEDLTGPGKLRGIANFTFFDNTGRTIYRRTNFRVQLQEHYVGVKVGGRYFPKEEPMQFEIVAINPEDQPLKDLPLEYAVIYHQYRPTYQSSGDFLKIVEQKKEQIVIRDTIASRGAPLKLSLTPKLAGNYRIQVRSLDGKSQTYADFEVHSKGRNDVAFFKGGRDGMVEIETDRSEYRTGERARIQFTTPVSGRLLVCFEQDKVLSYRYLDVPGNTAVMYLPITQAHLPNVIVSATLFRPQRYATQLPITTAHGYHNIQVNSKARELPVRIIAPELIRPGKTARITVQTRPGVDAMIALAAVDEGILAIRNYKTPDPLPFFYRSQRSNVDSYDMYAYLLPEVPEAEGLTGGGMGWEGSEYMSPFQARRFKPMVFWSGVRSAGSNGRITVEVPVPEEFNGDVRLMAVAYAGKSFGSGSRKMVARDNVILQPAIPRFITRGDSIVLPVNLMNMLGREANATIEVEVEGPLRVVGASKQEVSIPADRSSNLEFALATTDQVGTAQIRFSVSGDEVRTQSFEIAVRPPETYTVQGSSGRIEPGDTVEFTMPANYYEGLFTGQINISNSIAARMSSELERLLQYPHGCVEQITSKLFPQLYLSDLVTALSPESFAGKSYVRNINEGIAILASRQVYRGGFSYWPTGSYETDFTSIYATHFLVEAKANGYAVPEATLKQAIQNVRRMCGTTGLREYYEYKLGRWERAKYAPRNMAYALYVLARAGEPSLEVMNYYKDHSDLLTSESQILLASTFALTGDMKTFRKVMPENIRIQRFHPGNNLKFTSSISSNALVCNALLDAAPDHPHISLYINHLAKQIPRMYSTQDQAWSFLALGKAANRSSGTHVELRIDGKVQDRFKGPLLSYISPELAGKSVQLIAKGPANSYAYYSYKASGYPNDQGVKSVTDNSKLTISRRTLTPDGKEIRRPYFRQGELVVVELKLRALEKQENIAVTDLLPSAFEVENPRLRNAGNYNWLRKEANVAHSEFRDDRMVYFLDLPANRSVKIYYLARVVSRGQYLRPAASAVSMYKPDVYAYEDGEHIQVMPRDAELPFRYPASLHPDCRNPQEEKFRQLVEAVGEESLFTKMVRAKLMGEK